MASKRKAHKYWQSLENTIYEVKKVMEEQGVDILPTQKELIERGYSGLNVAISRYHGGLNNFREKHLGEELLRKPHGYYTLETTILEAKKVIPNFREIMNQELRIKSNKEIITALFSGKYGSLEDYIKKEKVALARLYQRNKPKRE